MSLFGVLLGDVPHQARGVLRLHGPDTTRFLQGTLSANLVPAPQGQAVPATLLTVKAKIISELIVLIHDENTIDLLVPADTLDAVAEHLDRHIIMDEVEVSRRDDAVVAALWGEGAVAAGRWASVHPISGALVVGSAVEVEAVLADATRVDAAAFTAHRVEHGIAGWGHEVQPNFFPPEVGFVGAVSYDKGCYLGQEPLARIHARGQVNRVMVQVDLSEGLQAPRTLAHPDRAQAGTLTTVAGARGLAIVRRSFAEAGTALSVEGGTVTVTSGPLGDDHGVGGRKG
ncbi:MAG: hypothetical protein AAGA54_03520 [Myxococcota bacterium]